MRCHGGIKYFAYHSRSAKRAKYSIIELTRMVFDEKQRKKLIKFGAAHVFRVAVAGIVIL